VWQDFGGGVELSQQGVEACRQVADYGFEFQRDGPLT
jgi:hypothetical protein